MSLLRESCHASRSSPGVVRGDLVEAAACGSKIYTLRGCKCTLCTGVGRGIGESFRSTTGVYSRPSQLFINKILYIRLLSVVCLVGQESCITVPSTEIL